MNGLWVGKLVHFRWPDGTVCHAAVVLSLGPQPDEALVMLVASRDAMFSLPAKSAEGAGWHHCDGGVCTAMAAS